MSTVRFRKIGDFRGNATSKFEDITPSKIKILDELSHSGRARFAMMYGITAPNRIFHERIQNIICLKLAIQAYLQQIDLFYGGYYTWFIFQNYFASYLRIFYSEHGHYPKIIPKLFEDNIEQYNKRIEWSLFCQNSDQRPDIRFIDVGLLRLFECDWELIIRKYYKGG